VSRRADIRREHHVGNRASREAAQEIQAVVDQYKAEIAKASDNLELELGLGAEMFRAVAETMEHHGLDATDIRRRAIRYNTDRIKQLDLVEQKQLHDEMLAILGLAKRAAEAELEQSLSRLEGLLDAMSMKAKAEQDLEKLLKG
jgi:hypothetical protein